MRTFDKGSEGEKVKRKKGSSSSLKRVQRFVASLDEKQVARMMEDAGKPYAEGGDATAANIFRQQPEIRAKLDISQAGDASELQADKVADAVSKGDVTLSRMTLQQAGSEINMKGEDGMLTTSPEFDSMLEASKGHGEKMDDDMRFEMEDYLGADLSDVNIHTGSGAEKMSNDINAKAFAHGQDIYFNNGNYDPASEEGKKLLAHELTHTQQQNDIERKIQRQDIFNAADKIAMRIRDRFSGISLKYGFSDFMYQLSEDELLRLEKLLYALEPDLMEDNYTETNFLVDGKRFSIQVGKFRLIIIDAAEAPGDYHHVYYGVNDAGTLETHYARKSEKNDKKFDSYRKQYLTSGTSGELLKDAAQSLTINVTEDPEASVKSTKTLKARLWMDNEQLNAVLQKDPMKGHVIGYNVKEKRGAQGRFVGLIQEALLFLDHNIPISKKEKEDEIFGISTYNAVIAYQKKKGLKPDGQVGPMTLEALDNDLVGKVAKTKELKEYYQKQTAEKQQKESEDSDLRKLRYNSFGFIIFNLPPLNKEELTAMGFDPAQLKFNYIEQGEYAETEGLGGLQYEVRYEGAYLGFITLQPAAGKPMRTKNEFYQRVYQGKLPKVWNEFLSGELFDLEYDEGQGGDIDLIDLIGKYAFKNHRGIDKRSIAMTGFEPLPSPSSGVRFMRTAPRVRIKAPGRSTLRPPGYKADTQIGKGNTKIPNSQKQLKFRTKTLIEQGEELVKLNGGKNRITLRTENYQIDIDLAGKAHFDKATGKSIPTPHVKISPRNFKAPSQPTYNTGKAAYRPATQQDLRLVRNYLEKKNR